MSPTFPAWLHLTALASLVLALACATFIAFDEMRRPQRMAVMNAVWPLCALFGSLIWLWLYLTFGRAAKRGEKADDRQSSFPASVSIGSSHCGAGCMLGDLVGEGLGVAAPGIAAAFGYGSLFHERMFALWGVDFLCAYLFGVGFQYFALKPMSDKAPGAVLAQALKADTLSIVAWQIGMYGGMAFLQFLWLRPLYGAVAPPTSPEFWLVMQIAMLAGFCTAWPMNAWLIRAGVKEAM